MHEIAPGLYDWTTFHEGIGQPVHSHLHLPSGTLIDPRVPEEGGVGAITDLVRPAAARRRSGSGPPHAERVVLTNRHHLRHAEAFVKTFGCDVFCHEAGLHEFAGARVDVRGFQAGDTLAPGVRVVAVGAITPEEVAIHLDVGPGFLALADIVIRDEAGALAFVPDELLGDEPEAVKRDMTAALARLADEEPFDGLLLAHGDPVASGARELLRASVRAWTPTS